MDKNQTYSDLGLGVLQTDFLSFILYTHNVILSWELMNDQLWSIFHWCGGSASYIRTTSPSHSFRLMIMIMISLFERLSENLRKGWLRKTSCAPGVLVPVWFGVMLGYSRESLFWHFEQNSFQCFGWIRCDTNCKLVLQDNLDTMLYLIVKYLRRQFPDVPNISVDELKRKIDSDADVLIIDSRTEEEYNVSFIPTAKLLPYKSSQTEVEDFLRENEVERRDSVVCYCSLGYRSSVLAGRIREYQPDLQVEVYNLEGSIFKWVNSNLSVVNPSGDTVQCAHPFSYMWGLLALKYSKWRWQ